MERTDRALRLYTQPSDRPTLPWSWVDGELTAAPTYWVVPAGSTRPHVRPVWGVWRNERIHLTVGSPEIRRRAVPGAGFTVHLDSGIDVVIVEGEVVEPTEDPDVIHAYNAKYDWVYDLAAYGPFMTIAPVDVLAWRVAGPAGRDSFQTTGRWTYR